MPVFVGTPAPAGSCVLGGDTGTAARNGDTMRCYAQRIALSTVLALMGALVVTNEATARGGSHSHFDGRVVAVDHRHRAPPAKSEPGRDRGSASNASVVDGSLSSIPAQTPEVSPQANTNPNPGLSGGSDPAIGQPSPPIPDIVASGGGSAPADHYGGGAETLASCMSFWDRSTHMSRAEWRQACNRTLNGVDLPVELGGQPLHHSGVPQVATHRAR